MEESLEQKKLQQLKGAIAEKKRTDSRNEQLVYSRKRAILRVEIRQLTNENMSIEDPSQNQSCSETFNSSILALKNTITNPVSQEDIWKALLQFDAIFKNEFKECSFTLKHQLSTDKQFLNSLFSIVKDVSLSEECRLGALQTLYEVTDSFKQLYEFGAEAETTVFEVYLGIFRSAKSPRVFSTVFQGMSQLCLDNSKASEFFVKNGLYCEILETFKKLQELQHESAEYSESLKDACILVHGLSLSKVPFDFADPRLKLILEYLIASNDSDIHYDVSTMLFHFTKQLACNKYNNGKKKHEQQK